jgi:hypothetical protein
MPARSNPDVPELRLVGRRTTRLTRLAFVVVHRAPGLGTESRNEIEKAARENLAGAFHSCVCFERKEFNTAIRFVADAVHLAYRHDGHD